MYRPTFHLIFLRDVVLAGQVVVTKEMEEVENEIAEQDVKQERLLHREYSVSNF